MASLILPSGEEVLFDDCDVELVSHFRWYAARRKGRVYAATSSRDEARIFMHRLIMGDPRGKTIDHREGVGLDNRRGNLRVCTQAQNCLNAGVKRPWKTFKGVFFDARPDRGRWWAQIAINRKRYFAGYFDSEVEAARAYDRMAVEHHGEFARLNFPAQRVA